MEIRGRVAAPSDKVAKPLEKSSIKRGIGSESLHGVPTASASCDESKKDLSRGWNVGAADYTQRSVEETAASSGKVVGVEKGNLNSGADS